MDRLNDLKNLTTFDLAFNLATGTYKTEEEKFAVLGIIKSRENTANATATATTNKKVKLKKAPLKGSKAEKIQQLIDKGKSPKDIYDIMNDKKASHIKKWPKTYFPEIYRLINAQEA
jgi:hypothetical protein